METIIVDWPMEWEVPINIQEVLAGPPTYALVDPAPNPSSNHNSDAASKKTPTNLEEKRAFEES